MSLPAFGLGTFRLKGQTVVDSVRTALELGYRAIDTAQIYENEADVGAAIAASGVPRSALFLTTKIWVAHLGADALIIADIALLDYAHRTYPQMELHLSVQASATNSAAIRFYQENFNIQRVVLPRVLSMHQVKQLSRDTTAELEVFAFGSLCIMAEGRCYLSSYMTGESPNTVGACSPARFVRWQETASGLESRLNEVLIDRYGPGENAGYPTLCKGRYRVGEQLYHALEEPTSLNTLALLPELFACGIRSVKIEGRQRSPAYVEQVTRVWRAAIDSYLANPAAYQVHTAWDKQLAAISEGSQTTLGAYHREWQ